jgi:microcin C transport system permease protein
MLMKNTLMDNLAQDYVRTAVAKGCSFRQAIFGHAVRNSLVPIATTFGGNIKLLVFGFLLVEQVFDIPGFGQLSYNALVERDYPIVMASIFLTALLMAVGNIISDILVALMNPRIRFE